MPEPAIASWCVKRYDSRYNTGWQVYHADEPAVPRVICNTRHDANTVATFLNVIRFNSTFLPSQTTWL